ncbi:MAG TPA: ABC transporter ATP-binding protein [Burkholderiales bacterium]|nr:ABC transporter ATP-binding protein [Burkholderiales bacterium]
MSEVIRTRALCKRFGGVVVAEGVNLTLTRGQIVGLIGPNGAGKTSLFNLICGAIPADSGSVILNGTEIGGLPMHVRARLGIARSWQHNRLFPSLTVLDNLLLAQRRDRGRSLVGAYPRSHADEKTAARERAMAQLEKVRMTHAVHRLPTELSYGKQKLISLARVLMNDGDCLLLDEPMAGVEGPAYDSIKAVVRDEAAAGRAICVVEHNISFIKDLCDLAVFMFAGRIIRTGTIDEMVRSPELTELYFGA